MVYKLSAAAQIFDVGRAVLDDRVESVEVLGLRKASQIKPFAVRKRYAPDQSSFAVAAAGFDQRMFALQVDACARVMTSRRQRIIPEQQVNLTVIQP